MKRSEHLEPLSHDHYEGLMVAGRIRLGLVRGGGAEDLSELARMMKAHIRFEERQLFPLLEKQSPEAALREAGTRLRDAHKDADLSWDPTFWE